MSILKVGNLQAASGEKVRGWLEITGGDHKLPVTLINGAKEGKTVSILAGTHASEYVGIESVIRLAKALEPNDIAGKIILVHLVNWHGFFAKSQYVNPIDGGNLGGVYPGKAEGTLSQRIAYTITEQIIKQSDFHMDLHGGDLHEDLDSFGWFDTNQSTCDLSRYAAQLMGTKFVSTSDYDSTAIGTAALLGVPGISPEIGGCGRWSDAYVNMTIAGITDILRYLQLVSGTVRQMPPMDVCPVYAIKCREDGCFYPQVEIGQMVQKGDLLSIITDLFGNEIARYTAPDKGEIFCVTRSLGVKSRDLMLGLRVVKQDELS